MFYENNNDLRKICMTKYDICLIWRLKRDDDQL